MLNRKAMALMVGLATAAPAGMALAADRGKAPPRVPPRASVPVTVNPNQADVKALMSLGFDETTAKAIVDYRTAKGPFQKLEDLLKVEGVTQEKLDAIRARVSLK